MGEATLRILSVRSTSVTAYPAASLACKQGAVSGRRSQTGPATPVDAAAGAG